MDQTPRGEGQAGPSGRQGTLGRTSSRRGAGPDASAMDVDDIPPPSVPAPTSARGRKGAHQPPPAASTEAAQTTAQDDVTALGEGARLNIRALQQFLSTVTAHESQSDIQVQNELLSRWHALSAEYELLEGRLLYFADQRNENVIRISERQKDGLEELEDRERKPVGEAHCRRLKELVSRQCLTLVKTLMAHKCSWPFNEPVDIVRFRDYLSVVKQPIDLGTIKRRLEASTHYESPDQVESDVRRVFTNARAYNAPGSDVYLMAMVLEDRFEEKWASLVLPKLQEEEALQKADETQLKRRKAEFVRKTFLQEGLKDADALLTDIVDYQRRLLETSSLAASLCSPLTEEERKELSVMLAAQPLEMRKALVEEARLCAGREAYDLDPAVAQSMDLDSLDALELRILQAMTRPRGYNQPIYPQTFRLHGGLEKGFGLQL